MYWILYASRAHPCAIHSVECPYLWNKSDYWPSSITELWQDTHKEGDQISVATPVPTPGSSPRQCPEMGRIKALLFGESAAGVSGHMQTMNMILIFLEDDFVFVAPCFPDHLLAHSLCLIYMDNKTCIRITTRTGLIWWMCTNKVVQIAGRFIQVVHCRGLRPRRDVGSIIKKWFMLQCCKELWHAQHAVAWRHAFAVVNRSHLTCFFFFFVEVNLSSFQIR